MLLETVIITAVVRKAASLSRARLHGGGERLVCFAMLDAPRKHATLASALTA